MKFCGPIMSCFEVCGAESYVRLVCVVVVSRHCGLVDNVGCEAVVVRWAARW
jgi:hypothetical protein